MISFLKKYGIQNDTIEKMLENNSNSYLYDLNSNEEECCKIIEYLLSIGITNIDDLLLYECDLFLKNKKQVEIAFSKYNLNEIVELINTDYNEIDLIFKYL